MERVTLPKVFEFQIATCATSRVNKAVGCQLQLIDRLRYGQLSLGLWEGYVVARLQATLRNRNSAAR